MSEILIMQIAGMACGSALLFASLQFVRRFLELRNERLLHSPAPDLTERLDRIEMMVETTAIEVERIAEANRFVAKLLAERQGAVIPAAKSPERVITPH
jgi:hypothetical protein